LRRNHVKLRTKHSYHGLVSMSAEMTMVTRDAEVFCTTCQRMSLQVATDTVPHFLISRLPQTAHGSIHHREPETRTCVTARVGLSSCINPSQRHASESRHTGTANHNHSPGADTRSSVMPCSAKHLSTKTHFPAVTTKVFVSK
jgi:hypothetical protein